MKFLLALIAVCVLGSFNPREEALAGILDMLDSEESEVAGGPGTPCDGYIPMALASQKNTVQITKETKKMGINNRFTGVRFECKSGYYNFACINVDTCNTQRTLNDYYVCISRGGNRGYTWSQDNIEQGWGQIPFKVAHTDSIKLKCKKRGQQVNGVYYNNCIAHGQCESGEYCTINGFCVTGGGSVSCGGHHALSCAACPQGHGAGWCHGDCKWSNNKCVKA